MRDRSPQQPQCAACGNRMLLQRFDPPGVALCPRCGALLGRGAAGFARLGRAEGLAAHVARHGAQAVRERVLAIVAQWQGGDPAGARMRLETLEEAVSWDPVELVMAIEEEFGA